MFWEKKGKSQSVYTHGDSFLECKQEGFKTFLFWIAYLRIWHSDYSCQRGFSGCKEWRVYKESLVHRSHNGLPSHSFITRWYYITQVNFNVNWQYVCLGESTNKCGSCKEPHSMTETEHRSVVCASRSYWLYGEFQWLAVELVPCCPQVHTRCLWAALPRFPHPGWLPPAACADSAGHTLILSNVMLLLQPSPLSMFSHQCQIWFQIKVEECTVGPWTAQPATDLDGSLSIGQRCLQSVGLVSVLSGLLLSLLKLTPQFWQWALQGRFLSLELLTKLDLQVHACSQKCVVS